MTRVLNRIGWLATCPRHGGSGDIGLVQDGALVWDQGRVVWAGRSAELPTQYCGWPTDDAGGLIGGSVSGSVSGTVVIPGLVDCHTHLAFAGWRVEEFRQRCLGATYQQIAAAGGGIAHTVTWTRQADAEDLYLRARQVLDSMTDLGVTTVECKSGYGLTVLDELKLLRVYDRLRREGPQTVVATFLGAHTVPPEFRANREGYLSLIRDEMLPRIAAEELAQFCDVFVEEGAFTRDEARAIFAASSARGLRPKLHADQLSDQQGAALAAEVGAVSADHLECVNDAGLAVMAARGVIAVLLPLASLYLRVPPADARRIQNAGVRIAVATDFNPGSAPTFHLPLALTLACIMNRLTPAEALQAGTINAARAIGLDHVVGSLEPGKRADFVVLDAESIDHWLYHFRANAVRMVMISGDRVR